MKCIDDQTTHELAQSSTILQCIISILEFECNKDHIQPEVIWVGDNEAMVDLDKMTNERIDDVCSKVNVQFVRRDKRLTCRQEDPNRPLVRCRALPLTEYIRLT